MNTTLYHTTKHHKHAAIIFIASERARMRNRQEGAYAAIE